jgi:filamentous hemagglutinin
MLSRDPETKKTICIECKASETARVLKEQQEFLDELAASGGTIKGNGKPGYGGGTVLPPIPYRIDRKKREDQHGN